MGDRRAAGRRVRRREGQPSKYHREGRGPAPAGRDESYEQSAMAGVLPGRAGPGPVRAERLPDLDLGDDPAQRALPGAPAAVLPALAAVPADAGTGAAGAG